MTFLPLDAVGRVAVETALLLVLAAVAGAWAARELGRSPAASATAGVLWALGGGLLSYQENPAVLGASLGMPVALALAARHARTGERRPALLAGVVLGHALLSGWPYGLALLAGPLALVWLGAPGPSTGGARARGLALAAAIALGVGAAQWLPTLELLGLSDRARGLDPEAVLGVGGFALADLARLVWPAIPTEVRETDRSVVLAYLGLPAVALALAGLRQARGPGLARLFALVLGGALALLLLPAIAPGLAARLASVPPFSLVRGPSKLLLLIGLAVSQLAALGVDGVGGRRAWGLALVVAVDLFAYGQRRALPVDAGLFRETPDLARRIPAGERLHAFEARSLLHSSLPPGAAARDFFRANAGLEPCTNVPAGVSVVGGYGPLPVGRSKRLALEPTPRHLARAGATRLAAPHERRLPFEPLTEAGPVRLYRLEALPRVRIAARALPASGEDEAFALAGRAPLDAAVVEDAAGASPLAALGLAPVASGTAALEPVAPDASSSPGSVVVLCRVARGPALLVLADTWYPGWEATVDGRAAPILRADFAFRGVVVPEGEHRVVFSYRPASFATGLAVTVGTLAAVGVALALGKNPRRLHPEPPGAPPGEAAPGGRVSP